MILVKKPGKVIVIKQTLKRNVGDILEGHKHEKGWMVYTKDIYNRTTFIIYPDNYPLQDLEEFRNQQIEKVTNV